MNKDPGLTRSLHRVCVFCGSRRGNQPEFAQAATDLGRQLATRGIALVYGGGRVGLMGLVADATLDSGGQVIGVIPEFLATSELLHERVPDMRIVPDMHTRKATMARESAAFIALPGGLGTLEELLEAITWTQLGVHNKSVGLLNVHGFFDPLLAMLDRAIDHAFMSSENRNSLIVDERPERLLDRLQHHTPPRLHRRDSL